MKEIYIKEDDISDIDKLDEYNKEYSIYPTFTPFATPENYAQIIENNQKLKMGIGNHGLKEIFYWAIEGNKIIGHASIRINPEIDESILKYAGHIMYGVVPSKRGQGIGSIICHLLIKEMKKLGYQALIITCSEDNIASSKVIEHNGGIYLETVKPDGFNTTKNTKRYLINVDQSLDYYNHKFVEKESQKKIR